MMYERVSAGLRSLPTESPRYDVTDTKLWYQLDLSVLFCSIYEVFPQIISRVNYYTLAMIFSSAFFFFWQEVLWLCSTTWWGSPKILGAWELALSEVQKHCLSHTDFGTPVAQDKGLTIVCSCFFPAICF